MEAQLGFSWQPDHVIWKPSIISHEEQQYYELPEQLDFKLADLPAITSEQPAPMAFINGAGKKLIQFSGLPSKNPTKKTVKQQSKTVASKKVVKTPAEPKEKPQWNNQVSSIGLFDVAISKKLPLDIQHAINKDTGGNLKKPTFFSDFQEIPVKPKSNTSKKPVKSLRNERIEENLEIKFIADQEELVRKLEKQLECEKLARQKLDSQFTEKLKEVEKMHKKVKTLQNPPPSLVHAKSNEKPANPTVHSSKPQALSKVQPESALPAPIINRSTSYTGIKHDFKGGNVSEPPTRDLSPMVLKANTVVTQKKPAIVGNSSVLHKPTVKASEKPMENAHRLESGTEIMANTAKDSNYKYPQPYTSYKQAPITFESHDIVRSDPILNSLSAAITRFNTADKYSEHSGVGLISRVSSKYIAYYANELTDMLIDDFLIDCVHDLQQIEEKKGRAVHQEFQKAAEENFEEIIKDFHEETRKIQSKYLNVSKFKPLKLVDEGDEGIIIEDKKRDWQVCLEDSTLAAVRNYRKKFQEFQVVFAGGSDGKLWDVYSRIGDDILDEVIGALAEEYDAALEEYTERMISHEFS